MQLITIACNLYPTRGQPYAVLEDDLSWFYRCWHYYSRLSLQMVKLVAGTKHVSNSIFVLQGCQSDWTVSEVPTSFVMTKPPEQANDVNDLKVTRLKMARYSTWHVQVKANDWLLMSRRCTWNEVTFDPTPQSLTWRTQCHPYVGNILTGP